jgi:hypothetical protein
VVGVEEDFGEELAYEAAGAGDEDLHCWCDVRLWFIFFLAV